jgi:glycosyltransferase involved in cell wall biosynthesis
MAAGKAIVATSVGGIPEIVQHQITGILVPPANEAALAAGILRLLKDSEERLTMGQAARKWVASHHNPHVIGRKIMAAYKTAMKR